MKLNKRDIHNLGILQLARNGVMDDKECLESMDWGRMTRARTQSRYLKRLVNTLANINMQHPELGEQHERAVKPTTESSEYKKEEQGIKGFTTGVKWE